jgi:hypothetical protein
MASIITFAISILVLIILLLAKWREEGSGSKNFVTNSISKLDPLASKINSSIEFRIKQVVQTVKYIFLIVIPQRSEEAFKEAKRAAGAQYKKQKDILMGRKDLVNGTAASFYLKKIRENQANGKSGRIEEVNM